MILNSDIPLGGVSIPVYDEFDKLKENISLGLAVIGLIILLLILARYVITTYKTEKEIAKLKNKFNVLIVLSMVLFPPVITLLLCIFIIWLIFNFMFLFNNPYSVFILMIIGFALLYIVTSRFVKFMDYRENSLYELIEDNSSK